MKEKKTQKAGFFFDENQKVETEIKNEEPTQESLKDVLTSLTEIEETESEPKKRGRKKKEVVNKEKEFEQRLLVVSTAYALISISQVVVKFIKDEKWLITDMTEAENLAKAIISYLEIRFPAWKNVSPELNLVLAFAGYFGKRL